MPRKTWSRLLAVPCLLTLALLAGAGKAAAQSCCDPDPCGPADVCTQVWHFGPDGEPYCEARCSPALNQCNHDGHCDEPQENQSNCWDDCHPCVPTETCEGRCGNIDDGCGHTLHCGSCAPPCNHDGVCDAGETSSCSDCEPPPPPPGPVCGNGVLESGENCGNCTQDAIAHPTFTVEPASPMEGQPVTLTAASGLVDDPPPPLWDLGNTEHRSGNPFVYTYPAAGTYNLILTASERNCHTTQLVSRPVTVRPRPPCDFSDLPPQLQVCCGNNVCDGGEDQGICPEDCGLSVGAGGPYEGSVGEAISFHATVGTTDPVTSYLWHFGDGATSSAGSPAHAYGAPGTYGVNVTVTTARGTGSATASATVHACNDNGQCEDGETAQCADCVGHPLCGNGVPDPGETCQSCPRDLARHPSFSFSPWAPFVGDTVVFTAAADLIDDPAHPLWDLGDTQHTSGNPYSHVYTSPGSYTVVLTAQESRCHTETLTLQTVVVRPRPTFCDFSDIPPNMQVCCGNETCDGGETPGDCPSDCGSQLQVSAGGPYQAAPGVPIDFHATVSGTAAPTSYLWTFGDGAFSSEPAPAHAYSAEKEYEAQVFVTTPGASGSGTARVTIGTVVNPEDDAEIVEDTFPPFMIGGFTYSVTVTMRNTGESTWVSDADAAPSGGNAKGFALAAKSGRLLPVGTRFTLPPGQRIVHNQEYTFAFDVVAPVSETFAATELQMVNQKTGWFGETRYYPVNIGEDSLGTLHLEPESGPPGTFVTVNLVSGPPIPEPARGRFSFGDPKAAPYSRVAVTTTRVSSVQATFVVPSDAGCGEYYYTIRKGPNSDDPSQPQYAPSLFTVTGPCDPTRRNSITVFNYNIQFLANTACTALVVFGGAPRHTCGPVPPLFCDDCHKDERLPLLAAHPDLQPYDVLVFEEAFTNDHRAALLDDLRPQYPYQSRPVGGESGSLLNQSGGVVILSKWPIEAESEHIFDICNGFFDDCRAAKGVGYARINKAGLRYNVFAVHTDSGNEPDDRNARTSQLWTMRTFIDAVAGGRNEPVVISGDFNVDKNTNTENEYGLMLQILNVVHPPTSYRDPTCPTLPPPPPAGAACEDDSECEQGQEWYVAECQRGVPGPGHCRYTPTCRPDIGTNLSGNWIDYVFYPDGGYAHPSFARNLVIKPTHPNSPYPGHNLSDHFAVLGDFRFDFPQNLGPASSTPPSAPPVGEAPSTSITDPTPTFTWTPAAGAASHTLSVSRADNGDMLLRQTRLAGSSFTADTALPSDVNLDWQVQGENSAGVGPASSALRFRIERGPSGPPTAAPVPASPFGVTREARPRFSWTSVTGATSYALQVVAAHSQVVVLDQAGIVGESFLPLADLPADLELVWSVRAESPFGPGPSSEAAHFTITQPPVVPPNQPPVASVSHTGTCTATGCSVKFSVAASDPDGDPLTTSWSGCATGSDSSVSCARGSEGTVAAQALVDDGRGGSAGASDSATVAPAAYAVGAWSACAATGAFTCSSNAADGCSRPGTKSRSVAIASWAVDSPPVAVPAPTATCTETAQGYIAGYNSTYSASWTCTTTGATGCYKDRLSYSPSGYRTTAPDAAVPAARIYTPGYVATWSVGDWGGCSASCGTGWRTRSVTPAGWTAVAPGASRPPDTETCNTQPCRLTCYDYGLYPTWPECYAEWPYCDTRYHDDGVGGLLTCRHGYQ